MTKKVQFIYVSAIPSTGKSGQNSFEKEIVPALADACYRHQGVEFKAFCPSVKSSETTPTFVHALPFHGKSHMNYLAFQWRLFFALGKYLWKHRRSKRVVFIRYHDSMIAPLVLHYLFTFKLLMRTGPVLPNLSVYKKNPSFLVYHSIRIILGLFFRRASKIITVTGRIKEWVVEEYGTPETKFELVPNAINTACFRPSSAERSDWGVPDDKHLMVFVGLIYEDAGLETVLRAMAILRQSGRTLPHLLVLGEGPPLPKLKRLATELGIEEYLNWAGFQSRDRVISAINSSDVTLAPFTRRAFETTGSSSLKLFEYLGSDRPIFASRAKDHAFIEKENFGLLIAPEDPPEWANALTAIHDWQEGLDGRGRKFVLDHHSYKTTGSRILDIGLQ